ncbi:hypothetical protein ACLESD_32970 [Pyxidicoccus sp. 3LFB2]
MLLSKHLPDFQAVNGDGGDSGNDGFCVGGNTLFQAFAPKQKRSAHLQKKIDDSIEKAKGLRRKTMPSLQRLIFLTPFDLTHEVHFYLQSRAVQAKLVGESWGESRLLGVLAQHPEVRQLFPSFLIADVLAAKNNVTEKQVAEMLKANERKMALQVVVGFMQEEVEKILKGIKSFDAGRKTGYVFSHALHEGMRGLHHWIGQFNAFDEKDVEVDLREFLAKADQLHRLMNEWVASGFRAPRAAEHQGDQLMLVREALPGFALIGGKIITKFDEILRR